MPLRADYRTIMHQFIRLFRFDSVLELGVANGNSTIIFLKALPDWGHLWSVDLNPCITARKNYEEKWKEKWTFYYSTDDLMIDWIREVDLIFIDTSHRFEPTLAELRKFSPFARNCIFLHDTLGHPEVTQAIEVFLKDDKKWAWAEWKHSVGLGLLIRIGPE